MEQINNELEIQQKLLDNIDNELRRISTRYMELLEEKKVVKNKILLILTS